jgi:methyltransferase
MTPLFWVLFSYCVLERLVEIVVSKRNQREMQKRGFIESETRGGIKTMVVMHAAWFVSLLGEALYFPAEIGPVARLLAATLFIATQWLRWWTLGTLGGFWNVSVLTNAKQDRAFVSGGPYRFIRHPNYLVVIVELLSLPLLAAAPLTAIVFSVANGLLLRRRISLEEQSLFLIPGYRQVMSTKPRFIPRLVRVGIS